MSHIVEIQTQVRDAEAVRAACTRLGLPPPVESTTRLFTSTVTGLAVQLPGWQYPVVCQLESGQVRSLVMVQKVADANRPKHTSDSAGGVVPSPLRRPLTPLPRGQFSPGVGPTSDQEPESHAGVVGGGRWPGWPGWEPRRTRPACHLGSVRPPWGDEGRGWVRCHGRRDGLLRLVGCERGRCGDRFGKDRTPIGALHSFLRGAF